jgi:hypothetical protein
MKNGIKVFTSQGEEGKVIGTDETTGEVYVEVDGRKAWHRPGTLKTAAAKKASEARPGPRKRAASKKASAAKKTTAPSLPAVTTNPEAGSAPDA